MKKRSPSESGMLFQRKAQSAVMGLLFTLILVLLAGGLVDIYRLFAARTWAYSLAQEAALAGASLGRDWDSVATDGGLSLDPDLAQTNVEKIIQQGILTRGISTYTLSIQVLPDPEGGMISGFPPSPVRLGEGLSDWSSDEPAVGVYLEMPFTWTLLDIFGIEEKVVRAFAAAGVAQ